MKFYYATRAEAQAEAARLHQWMLANDAVYAASVKAGQTKAWAIPRQDVDENGKVIDVRWWITKKDRCAGAG